MNNTEEQIKNILKDAKFLKPYVEMVENYHNTMYEKISEKQDVKSSLYALYQLQNYVNCLSHNVDYLVEKYDKEIQELLKGLE